CIVIGDISANHHIKIVTDIINKIVKREINTKCALQPNIFPNITPIGRPNTKEPLTPMTTNPIARPRYAGSTIFEAKLIHKIMTSEPLAAETTRDNISNSNEELN